MPKRFAALCAVLALTASAAPTAARCGIAQTFATLELDAITVDGDPVDAPADAEPATLVTQQNGVTFLRLGDAEPIVLYRSDE